MYTSVSILKAACVVVPAAAMAAAHWFPWKRTIKRDLHKLEAYAIGTAAIVGTAAVAISVSEGDRDDHAALVLWAAAAAGATTLIAYAVDQFVVMRGEIAALTGEKETLTSGNLR